MASIEQIKNSSVVTKTTIDIDTFFRTSGDVNNFTFDLGTTIEEVQLIEILAINFVNILNNIDSSNNKINWVDNSGVTHFDELEPGNYSLDTLFTEISNVMSESSSINAFYTVAFNFNTNKTTINNTNGVTFDLNFGVSADETIGDILGFGTTNYVGITEITSDQTLEVIPTKKIYIGSTTIAEGATDTILLSNGVSNVCYGFNVDNVFGNVIIREVPRSIKNNITALTSLDFTLRDDNGDLLKIPSDVNETTTGIFSITLDIYAGVFDLSYYN